MSDIRIADYSDYLAALRAINLTKAINDPIDMDDETGGVESDGTDLDLFNYGENH